jgi:hypothetical protein
MKFILGRPSCKQKITNQVMIQGQTTTPVDSKIDISVEIRLKSPDVNLETGVDVSVVSNKHRSTAYRKLNQKSA